MQLIETGVDAQRLAYHAAIHGAIAKPDPIESSIGFAQFGSGVRRLRALFKQPMDLRHGRFTKKMERVLFSRLVARSRQR
jgi:hypothetical protein